MCDGWSSRTRKPIINFMVYCDRSMIYLSLVDTTNIPKTTDYIFSLVDKMVVTPQISGGPVDHRQPVETCVSHIMRPIRE